MTAHDNNTNEYYPGEQKLFSIRGSVKKRIITASIVTFFVLLTVLGLFVFKNSWLAMMGPSAFDGVLAYERRV